MAATCISLTLSPPLLSSLSLYSTLSSQPPLCSALSVSSQPALYSTRYRLSLCISLLRYTIYYCPQTAMQADSVSSLR